MDYVLLQNVDKNLIYYGIYSTDSEIRDGSDILCTARKKYFETGTKQRDRSTLKTPYETFRYSYSLEDGAPLKFRKLRGTQQIERVAPTPDGYYVETSDYERHPIKKTYFDNRHMWKKTEFFSLSDRSAPIFVLFPSIEGEKPVILRKVKNGRTDTLYPFNISLDKELTDKLNILTNEPRIFCVTSSGSFYFCTNEEAKERRNALNKLLEREKEKAEQEDENESDTSDEEETQSAFVVDGSKLNGEKKLKGCFDLKNSTEIRVSEMPTEEEEPIGNDDFFSKIEEIAKKNHIDISAARNKKLDSDILPDREDSSESSAAEETEEKPKVKPVAAFEFDDDDTEPVEEINIKLDDFTAFKVVDMDSNENHQKAEEPVSEEKTKKTEKPVEQPKDSEPKITEREAEDEPVEEIAAKSEKADSSEEVAATQTECVFASECPYEMIDKQIIEAGGRQYYYFGDLDGGKRSGRGRTVMKNGDTAYEGQYLDDKRSGFGVYYYKSGKLCYTGNWKQNKREGLGIAFSPNDGSAFVGEWHEDRSVNVGASFDSEGKMLYAGNVDNGRKNGTGITYNDEDKTFFVGKYKDGEFLGTGTQFDSEGTLLYTGEYRDNKRCGSGTSYNGDGTVEYKGQWLNNQYDGEGKLNLPDGGMLKGSFKNGKAYGKCVLTDSDGKVIYTGSFVDDNYNGTGRLYSDDGSYAEGRFVDGEPTGIFNEYTKDKKLVYCGEWTDMHRNGRGIEYRDGEKIYEGEFRDSVYHGEGKLFENGRHVYSGAFSEGKRCGFGVEFKEEEIIYRGMWSENKYNGCGILYRDGEARFVGMFSDGMRNGRINEIQNHKVIRRSLYKDNVLTYMCEYSPDGSLEYYGGVKENMRNGMGCSFMASCEKQFEGIFKNGKHEKAMKVVLKELSALPICQELENTEYDLYRKTPQYIIEKPISNGKASGIYTGRLKDGRPDGSGTILYSDHRFTGIFDEGKPEGEGIIYMNDGRERKGYFSTKPFTDCETVILSDITYYYSERR